MDVTLTPTMQEFVRRMANEGRATSAEEFIRFLVASAIRDWEKVHGHAYNPTLVVRR